MKDMSWKTLKSEYLFRRPWLTVRCDEVQLPNGKVNPEFYVLEYPSWVNIIAIDENGDFVMIRQFRYGLGDTRFELVAGVVEAGEDTLHAAKRELEEETGYTGGEWSHICTISGNPSTTNNLTYCYLAKGVKRTAAQHLDETEDVEVHILKREEVLDLMLNDEIKQSLMLAPLWKYFYLHK